MCKIFKSLSFIVVLLTASHGFSQIEFMGEAALKGIVSSNEKSPFWFHSNQRGRVTDSTNLAAWLTAKTKYETNSGLRLEFGGGVLFEDSEDKIVIDELYVQFENTWLKIVGGRKQQKELYNGLSATNENILYSLNSRPIPGIEFSTLKPFRLSESLSIEATLGEYFLENDRYIKNARLHHKSMAITYAPNENWEFTYGLQHFAQWGGTKPNGNKEPQGLKDYVKIFFLRKGGANAGQPDQDNTLGNHLGSHELYITRNFKDYSLKFLYNNLFEDGSGSWFGNFPDGRYGLYMNTKDPDRIVNSFIYEFYYTKDQSKDTRWGKDNYFNHGPTYYSGWTYLDRVIGLPLFTKNPDGLGIVNSEFVAHHFGIGGQFPNYYKSYPYKLMVTYYRNDSSLNNLYLFTNAKVYSGIVDIEIQLGSDFKENSAPTLGAGVQLSRKF